MRISILGATGLLGQALVQNWRGDTVRGYGSRQVDIRNPQQVSEVLAADRPDWVILTAALADVDACEKDPALAFAVNTQGPIHVAEAVKKISSRLLFISTDYVFDGKKNTPYEADDLRAPVNVYGKSKVDAEVALMEILLECCVVRTTWLFGSNGKSFPENILNLAATRKQLEVVADQRGCPTFVADVAQAIQQLCRQTATGIIHVTNAGDATRFEFAREILKLAGSSTVVQPTTSDRFPRPAARPKYSVLSPRSLHAHGIHLPTWQDALDRFMEQREKI